MEEGKKLDEEIKKNLEKMGFKVYGMENVAALLNEFIDFVKGKVDDALKKEEIKKVEINQDYFKWKIDEFEYSMESGVLPGATGQHLTKKHVIYSHNLDATLSNSIEFEAFVAKLKEIYHAEDVQFKLQLFLWRVIQDYLDNKQIDPHLIELFIKELNGEPTRAKAIVRLQGVTVEEPQIKLTNLCTIRRITKEDIEEEIPVYLPFLMWAIRCTTA